MAGVTLEQLQKRGEELAEEVEIIRNTQDELQLPLSSIENIRLQNMKVEKVTRQSEVKHLIIEAKKGYGQKKQTVAFE